MEWTSHLWGNFLLTLEWIVRLGLIFGVLAWLMPCNRNMYWWKAWGSSATDFLYFFVTPLIVPLIRMLAVWGAIAYLFDGEPGFDALRRLPVWKQCILIVLMQDVMLYWIHRGFHNKRAWQYHAVHHSSKTLDWPSAARFHLINHVLSFVVVDVVVLLLGFSMQAMMVLMPLNMYYSAMVHANLNWTFGPLRYVFASPVFHRWHHVAEGEGINKNFASTFPVLDQLFGTFYMPKGEIPGNFGNGDEHFPETFWEQFLYPFRTKTSNQLAQQSLSGATSTTEKAA